MPLLLMSGLLHAQARANVDSLLRVLQTAKEDTNKVTLLNKIVDGYENSDMEKARKYILAAGELSNKLHYEPGILKQYRSLAYIAIFQSKYDSVLYYNQIVLDIATKKKDTFNIGVSLFNMGEAYRYKGDFDKAVELVLQSVRLLEGKGYANIEPNLYLGLQNLYISLRQMDKAIAYGEKAAELGRKTKNYNSLVSALNNLGVCFIDKGDMKKGKKVYLEALDIAIKTGNKSIEASVYTGLQDVALRENDPEAMKRYAEGARRLNTELNDQWGIMAGTQGLACYYILMKDYKKAEEMAKEALNICNENDFKEGKAYVLQTLSNISFALGKPYQGFNEQNESSRFLTEVYTENLVQKESSMRVKYETEKKEEHIKKLEAEKKVHEWSIRQKNTLNYFLIAGGVTVLLIFLLSYRNYKQKQKLQQQRINELETEKQLAATEAVLKGEEQERTRLAKDLHDGLGGMLSGIKYSLSTIQGNLIMTPDNHQAFERSMDMLDSSINEMRRVAHNMMPESLLKFGLDAALRDFCKGIRQSGALEVTYQSIGLENQSVDQTIAITIYRIVQELISNSIRHAAAKTAIVQLTKTDGLITVTVEDNGQGFDPNALAKSSGIGWSNIKNRIAFLKGKLDIQSGPGKGTSVLIELNNAL